MQISLWKYKKVIDNNSTVVAVGWDEPKLPDGGIGAQLSGNGQQLWCTNIALHPPWSRDPVYLRLR